MAKEDKDGFDASCNSLLTLFSVVFIHFDIDGIINKQGLWVGDSLNFFMKDSSSFRAKLGLEELHIFTPKRLVSLKLI